MPLQKPEVPQTLGGFHDRGLNGTRPPAQHALRPLIMDDQIGQFVSRRFLGRNPLGERPEPLPQDLGQLKLADRRPVGQHQEALAQPPQASPSP